MGDHIMFLLQGLIVDQINHSVIAHQVLKSYPKLSDLVSRVGAMPNVKKWMETRPANGEPQKGFMIYFKNAYQILEEDLV